MMCLWDRIDRGITTPEVASEVFQWFADRIVCDDVLDRLRDVLPDAPEEQLLAVVFAITSQIGEP